MPDTQACGLLAAKLLRSLGLRPDFQTHRPAACSQLGPAARFPDTQACGLFAAWACGPISRHTGLRPVGSLGLRPNFHARHTGLRPVLTAATQACGPSCAASQLGCRRACGPSSSTLGPPLGPAAQSPCQTHRPAARSHRRHSGLRPLVNARHSGLRPRRPPGTSMPCRGVCQVQTVTAHCPQQPTHPQTSNL